MKFFICMLLLLSATFAVGLSNTTHDNTVRLDTIVTPKNPFVQSQILYQLKLYYDVNVTAGSIYPPYAENAIIKQLGQDQSYNAKINGKNTHVYQRNFVIFPQNAGELIIHPAIFRGTITETSKTSYAGFSSLDLRPLQLVAPTTTLIVQPIPTAAGNHWWLPTENLTLTETWSTVSDQINQNTPLSRTITLQASNVIAAQLPQISSDNTADYNSYPNQPILDDTLSNNQLIGIKTEKIDYIPNHSGTITFPAVTVYWWNTKTNTLETAILPSKSFTVLAGTNTATIKTAAPLVQMTTKPVQHNSRHVFLSTLIFCILGFIILLIVWWFRKDYNSKHTTASITLKQACETNDPQAAKKALIHWAQHKFNQRHIFSIGEILPLINDPNFLQELHLLQNKLYQQTEIVWIGKNLWQCIKKFKIKKHVDGENSLDYLPSLNPDHSDMRKAD